MKRQINKISLNKEDLLKKQDMKWLKGGYLYCTAKYDSIVSGYCGTGSTTVECCWDIYLKFGWFDWCTCS